ncbi:hypothetical protein BU16DRAFT_597652 [Lophium mytilinum]|uniref:CDP-alcohol phosphatidyltransferase n=1 Tax=Lophium mytilinum TaxID=390894 RepID=A0A6A6QDD1_9PEZI|nr:hypothetical protein BU16DRAFT_597652 [Lophium mytilinum]
MLDITFRPLKDRAFDPICRFVPLSVTPLHVTGLAFVCGILACNSSLGAHPNRALFWWSLNRILDCLDGALARSRNQASDLGGFLDLLGDFTVYSLIPMSCAAGAPIQVSRIASTSSPTSLWTAVATLEASFYINNFVLFYIAAVLEKRKTTTDEKHVKELTSVAMRPALIEGLESGIFFTLMLACPNWVGLLCWVMASLVAVGICQRTWWLVPVLS